MRQPSGDILIGGTFSEVQGVPRRGLALLDSNGVLRAEFDPVVEGGRVDEFGLLPDGTILVHGDITAIDGVEVGELFKLRIPQLLPPAVEILWPTNGTEIHTSDAVVPFDIQVRAFDPDGFLRDVVVTLDEVPLATNTIGNFVLRLPAAPREGDRRLTVTATDESGLQATRSVTFKVIDHPFPPGRVEVRNENGRVQISYRSGRLQSSSDLRTWRDVHSGGGELAAEPGAEYQFYRVVM